MTTYRLLAGPVRYIAAQQGMSQNALADKVRTERSHLSRVLNGHATTTWELGHRVAVALGVPDDAVMEAAPATVAA